MLREELLDAPGMHAEEHQIRLGQGLLPLFDLRLQGFQIGQLPLGPLQLLLVPYFSLR